MHFSVAISQSEFTAGTIIATKVNGVVKIIGLDRERDLNVVFYSLILGVFDNSVSTADFCDLSNAETFFASFFSAFDDIVLFSFVTPAVDGLPTVILRKNIAKLHIVEVRLIEESVLPDKLHVFAAVFTAVECHGCFIASALIFRISLEENSLAACQRAACRVDGQPGGIAGNSVIDLSIWAGIVDGSLYFGLTDSDVFNVRRID